MATYWTLTYGGLEKSFAAWGLDEETAEAQFANMAIDIFTVAVPGAKVEADPIFAFEAAVVIQRARVLSLIDGSWSGGVIEFQGKRLLHVLDGRPDYEGIIYQFSGPWYDIAQTPYQQTVYSYSGDPDAPNADLVSNVVLFQKVTAPGVGAARNSGQQIGDILQHVLDQYSAQGMAAPYQIGTIDPAVNLMTYQLKDIKCDEAIQMCLRSSPEVKVWFNYLTAPPTVNVRAQANCTAASVAIGDGVSHESIRLSPRYDLQARAVVLYFEQVNTVSGVSWLQRTKQKYPADGPEGGLRVIVQTIDLAGANVSTVSGSLSCTAVANNRAWWAKYIPELQSKKIRGFSVGAMTVLDETGAAVSLSTYPNVLDDGSNIATWMKLTGGADVAGVKATITAIASYTEWDSDASGDPETSTNGRKLTVFPSKGLALRVTLTNGVSGPYSTVASSIAGEDIPSGLAQSIWTSLNTLQYDGSVQIVETECSGSVGMGNVLNLTGGRTEWATMKALIQTVTRKYGTGQTQVAVGPARDLSAGDLTQLFLINRNRRVWMDPSFQKSPEIRGRAAVVLGAKTAKENSQTGLEERSLLVTSAASGGNIAQIMKDASNKQFVMNTVDSAGAQVSATSSIKMAMADIEVGSAHRQASFQWFYFKDAKDSCSAKKCLVLMTAPEADT